MPAPGGAPASAAPSNVLDPQAHARRRLKHKSSSGSKEASGMTDGDADFKRISNGLLVIIMKIEQETRQ